MSTLTPAGIIADMAFLLEEHGADPARAGEWYSFGFTWHEVEWYLLRGASEPMPLQQMVEKHGKPTILQSLRRSVHGRWDEEALRA